MKTGRCLLFSIGVIVLAVLMTDPGWALPDYSFEYVVIDCSGGAVHDAGDLAEDILSAELQGLSDSRSASYNISSILRWPAPRTAASNWAVYK